MNLSLQKINIRAQKYKYLYVNELYIHSLIYLSVIFQYSVGLKKGPYLFVLFTYELDTILK